MKRPDDQMLVIFGASGDLAKRKLIPSLFELFLRKLLPDKFVILGASRTDFTDEQYREEQREFILSFQKERAFDTADLDRFLQMLFYIGLNTNEDEGYAQLGVRITGLQKQWDIPDNVLFYMATPPLMYEIIPAFLQKSKLNVPSTGKGWRRIIVEKPFGVDLKSAQHLNKLLKRIFNEKEIYRIDHYLGKETVQNIIVLRFANGIFEPLWNRNYVDSVEIFIDETLGVENRGRYYEGAGALRDMIQNHLMQLMAFVAMEPPATFDSEAIRDEIVKVFRSLHSYSDTELFQNVVRAQYGASLVDGKPVPGYREEKDVSPDSTTETYVAMKLFIDNWRWGKVPFYLYTGKRLAEKKSEIVIHFKSTPQTLFAGQCSGSSCNKLTLRIQPDESISLQFGLKLPGAGFEVKQVSMDFRYDSLSENYLPDAYERLLLDAMLGDSTLYARSDALEASWKFIDPILKGWAKDPKRGMLTYNAGSVGPVTETYFCTIEPPFSSYFRDHSVCQTCPDKRDK